ncbi:insulinase family protein, partial [Candidatus Bathyarchaeota archaeon]|nr:insulinase family protein [Candidatus Bathyarchaeota archaeon]
MPKEGFYRQSALLAVDFGSIDCSVKVPGGNGWEREIPAGTAHFLEHLMFQKPGGDISELFSLLGADVDADTSFIGTSFFCSGNDHLEENLQLLLKLVFEPHLTQECIDREREIIFREIQLSEDNLEWISYFHALETIFPGHPLSTDIAGNLEEIGKIDLETLELCYRAFYSPPNMALYICGDIDPFDVAGKIGERVQEQKGVECYPHQPHCRTLPPEGEPLERRRELPVVQPHLTLAFRDRRKGLGGAELLKRELALELLLDILFGPG